MDTPIVVEQVYKAPLATVWRAITDKNQMPLWFFQPIADFEPRVGFETSFTVSAEGHNYVHQWKVTEVVPQRRLVYDWNYGDTPGASFVIWELYETADGTTLRLTHTGHETFPRDNPVFSREAGEAGWNYFLRESLKAFLEK